MQVLTEAKQPLGAVYLAGYVVECRLKRFLQLRSIRFPRSGSEGHNLRGLWASAGFSKPPGHGGLFIDHWDTDLRYKTELPEGVDSEDLLKGGRDLAGWVATRIRQVGSRHVGKGRSRR
ncbi:hypothetical protein GCM10009757_38350 [Streptomyces cheonanensis]|uniref:HEPN domain-containing protein n=1 Tax=Streptomyces cheonanensis TaxID=312720 RepID=A0ABN2VBN2_9ACTN